MSECVRVFSDARQEEEEGVLEEIASSEEGRNRLKGEEVVIAKGVCLSVCLPS